MNSPEQVKDKCPWCGQLVIATEPCALVDGEVFHLNCAAEDADNATFDRDMGDSS